MSRSKEKEGFQIVKDEQIKALQDTQNVIDKLEKYKQDYVALHKRLHTLPDRISYDVMVPFGKFAFMPGQLVHTNEILVLLGDNWFTERSAKQASEIAGRRIKELHKQIESFNEQKQLLLPRLGFTTELGNLQSDENYAPEIREEFDKDADKAWREKHRKNVRVYSHQLRKDRESAAKSAEPEDSVKDTPALTDEDLWKRLDDLEKQERRKREMFCDVTEEPESEKPSFLRVSEGKESEQTRDRRHIKWKDEVPAGASESDSEDSNDENSSSGDEPVKNPNTLILFKHSDTTASAATSSSESGGVVSPADIYRQFVITHKEKPKSILKSPSSKITECPPQQYDHPEKVHQVADMSKRSSGCPQAFTGQVIENPSIPSAEVQCKPAPPITDSTKPAPPITDSTKKVSKFKARRAKKS